MRKFGMALDHFELRAQLSTAPDLAACFALVGQALTHLGASEFSYGALTKTGLAARPISIDLYHASLEPGLLAKLGGKRRYEDDLTGVRATLGLDTDWTDEAPWADASPAQQAQSLRELDMGYTLGYTRVLGQSGGLTFAAGVGMGGLSASEFVRHWAQLSPQIFAILNAMHGHFLCSAQSPVHLRAEGRLRSGMDSHYALSPREKDVLCWLALGLRPDEIALNLQVGYRTVDKYIVSARQKLGARTRDHAVAKALALHLILP